MIYVRFFVSFEVRYPSSSLLFTTLTPWSHPSLTYLLCLPPLKHPNRTLPLTYLICLPSLLSTLSLIYLPSLWPTYFVYPPLNTLTIPYLWPTYSTYPISDLPSLPLTYLICLPPAARRGGRQERCIVSCREPQRGVRQDPGRPEDVPRSVSQSVSQLVSQLVSQSVNDTIRQWVSESANEW